MAYYRLKKGYDIRIAGEAEKLLEHAPFPEAVGLYAADFYGMTPKPLVEGGERVKVGTPLWRDRRRESLVVTSPASGTVAEVRRGERRALEAVIIRTDGKQHWRTRRRRRNASAPRRGTASSPRSAQPGSSPSSASAPSARSQIRWPDRAISS